MAVVIAVTAFSFSIGAAMDGAFSVREESGFCIQSNDHAKSEHNNIPLDQEGGDERTDQKDQKDSETNKGAGSSFSDFIQFSKSTITCIADRLHSSFQPGAERKVSVPLFILHHSWKDHLIA